MEERQHAILSASSSHRWLTCTPSARLEQEEGQGECSIYAQEGTAAHELAEMKLSYRFGKITVSEYKERYEAFKKEWEQYYNPEFEEYVDDYVEFVIKQTEGLKNYHIYFELKVNYSNVVPMGYGTSDVVLIHDKTIHIIDLKFGQGVPVSAYQNSQLRLYAMGTLNLFPNAEQIKMTIYQPRLLSTDSEELTKQELLDWSFKYVMPRAEKAIKGEGVFTPSEKACRFCKLRGKCKARADMQLGLAQKEFAIEAVENNKVQNLSPDKIAEILEIAPLFIDWFKDVQSYALGQLMQGVKIPGFKLVEGRSNRIITDEQKVKDILVNVCHLTEDDIMKPRELLGISGLEKIVGKKLFAELCKDYIIKPMGKLTVAEESDRRPAVNTVDIAISEFAESIKED